MPINALKLMQSTLEKPSIDINLFFIERLIKPEIKKSAKIIDKYNFAARTVDLSKEINQYFLDVATQQIKSTISKKDLTTEEYSVVSDDLNEKLYTYALNNALSFSDIVLNQLNMDTAKSITSLKDIKNDLWAYCLKFSDGENTFYTFRKMSQGKVATDEPQKLSDRLSSFFDSTTSELKLMDHDAVNFDNKIDCFYASGIFYILRKSSFEQIVGLEEEFKEAADSVIKKILETNLIEGMEHLQKELLEKRSVMKALSNIAKKGTHLGFNGGEIEKMKAVLKAFEGEDLKTSKEGKILLENSSDVTYLLKLLNDYYKQGMVSGKYYGSNSGHVIEAKVS